jgi:hypothetical protein
VVVFLRFLEVAVKRYEILLLIPFIDILACVFGCCFSFSFSLYFVIFLFFTLILIYIFIHSLGLPYFFFAAFASVFLVEKRIVKFWPIICLLIVFCVFFCLLFKLRSYLQEFIYLPVDCPAHFSNWLLQRNIFMFCNCYLLLSSRHFIIYILIYLENMLDRL